MRYSELINESLEEVKDAWSNMGIDFSLYQHGGVINLNKIKVPKEARMKGLGTKAMKLLIDYADQSNQKIGLSPSSDFGGNKERLIKFYRQFGFVPNKGKYKDFLTRETMIRYPKA